MGVRTYGVLYIYRPEAASDGAVRYVAACPYLGRVVVPERGVFFRPEYPFKLLKLLFFPSLFFLVFLKNSLYRTAADDGAFRRPYPAFPYRTDIGPWNTVCEPFVNRRLLLGLTAEPTAW